MLTLENIKIFDSEDIFGKLRDSARQWMEAVNEIKTVELSVNLNGIRQILITGMGEAGFPGDFIRSYCLDVSPIPIHVNKSYSMPAFTGPETLVIALSYSGNTEETVFALKDAIAKNAPCIAVSSGGKIATLHGENGFDFIRLTSGLSSRSALAGNIITLWRIFQELGIIEKGDAELNGAGGFLQDQINAFSVLEDNLALELAEDILDTLPIIYSCDGFLEPVNMRWRNQINLKAKTPAFGSLLPEMNHNEIVGWERTAHLMGKLSCIMLEDENDHPRNKKRMEITAELLEPHAVALRRVRSTGRNKLERLLYMIILGDYVSYYVSILSETNPSTTIKIDLLKGQLEDSP